MTTLGWGRMLTISLKDAKAGFSHLVDEAIKGEFVTITGHGKPVAALFFKKEDLLFTSTH